MTSIRTAVAGMGIAVVLVAGAVSSVARAEMSDSEKYLTIGSVRVDDQGEVQLDRAEWNQLKKIQDATPSGPVSEAGVIIDQIINMGKKVWSIVEAGRPVVSYTTDVASAVPMGITRWDELSSWEAPRAHLYHTVYSNLYGASVVDFTYRVVYTSGGTFGGKGHYLTQVMVVPDELNVSWGYTFNADVTVPSVVNMGSVTEPMAGMQLLVHWKVDTVLKHSETSTSYLVQGDGTFKDLTNGN